MLGYVARPMAWVPSGGARVQGQLCTHPSPIRTICAKRADVEYLWKFANSQYFGHNFGLKASHLY